MFAHPFSFFPFRNLFFCELSCCLRVCIQASVLLVGFLMFSVRLGGWYFISNKRECEFLHWNLEILEKNLKNIGLQEGIFRTIGTSFVIFTISKSHKSQLLMF
jgi:hypothetical protein